MGKRLGVGGGSPSRRRRGKRRPPWTHRLAATRAQTPSLAFGRAPHGPAPPLGTWSAARAQPRGTNYPPHHAPRSCSRSARTAPFRTATCALCVCVSARAVGWAEGGGRANLPGDLFSSPLSRPDRAPVPPLRPPKFTNFARQLPWPFPSRCPHLFECAGVLVGQPHTLRVVPPDCAGAGTHIPQSPLGPAGFGGAPDSLDGCFRCFPGEQMIHTRTRTGTLPSVTGKRSFAAPWAGFPS